MTTMTLGQLKDALQAFSETHAVRFSCNGLRVQPTSFGSWRGFYAELALGYESMGYAATAVTVGELLTWIKSANGCTFEGWKGGDFKMDYNTPVHVDNRGCYTKTDITGVRFIDGEVIIMIKEKG